MSQFASWSAPPNTKCQPQDPSGVKNDTASTDPTLVKARLFVGCLKNENCTREDLIEVFSQYGLIRGVSFFAQQGFAYIQFEDPTDAQDAARNLNKFKFKGMDLNVKIANPNMQKAMKQGSEQEKWQGGSRNQSGPKQQHNKFGANSSNAHGKSFPNNASAPIPPLNLFGTVRSTPSKFVKPPPKTATAANAIPIGNAKTRKPMPSQLQHAKKPRFDSNYSKDQQRDYSQTDYNDGQDQSYYDQQQQYDYGEQGNSEQNFSGYENPYGDYDAQAENAANTYPEGQYAEGEYREDEYTGYYYVDEFGQPVDVPEGYEGYEYDPNYEYGSYVDENGQTIEYMAPREGYEGQEYGDGAYYDQSGQYGNEYYNAAHNSANIAAPNLEPPSKSRKAEFVHKLKPQPKPQKQPQATQELKERPIHYNYEIPDMFICGGCHYCTANPQKFIQHRSNPCLIKQVKRGDEEPEDLRCSMCSELCKNSWDLVRHLGQKHCLYLFNETHLANDN